MSPLLLLTLLIHSRDPPELKENGSLERYRTRLVAKGYT